MGGVGQGQHQCYTEIRNSLSLHLKMSLEIALISLI